MLTINYLFAAAAGVIWYFQFFFYSMGQTKMGKYDFSGWTLHMASIIIFSTLWGIMIHEWRGTSFRTRSYVAIGLALLIVSTFVVGYGNYLQANSNSHTKGTSSAQQNLNRAQSLGSNIKFPSPAKTVPVAYCSLPVYWRSGLRRAASPYQVINPTRHLAATMRDCDDGQKNIMYGNFQPDA